MWFAITYLMSGFVLNGVTFLAVAIRSGIWTKKKPKYIYHYYEALSLVGDRNRNKKMFRILDELPFSIAIALTVILWPIYAAPLNVYAMQAHNIALELLEKDEEP